MKSFITAVTALAAGMLATPVPEPESAPVVARDTFSGSGPWTIQLKGREVDSSIKRRTLRPGCRDVPLTTWLVNGQDVQYYTEFTMGTPPQKLTANIDTAYTYILIPGASCGASCGSHNRFDGSKSSTYSPFPAINNPLEFGTGGTTVPLASTQVGRSTGRSDKVCLGGLCVANQTVFVADEYASALNEQPFDGLFGMSIVNGSEGWWEQVVNSGQVRRPEFSLFMIPGLKYGAELTLGGRDPTKFKGPVTTVELNHATTTSYHFWAMDIPAVYVDGKRVLNLTSPGNVPINYGVANMDLATAGINTPDNATAAALYAAISPRIFQIDTRLGVWGAPCRVLDQVAKDIVFTFGSTGKQQYNVTIPRGAFNAGPYPPQPNLCQAIFNNNNGTFDRVSKLPGWIVGAPIFRNTYSIWNGLDQTMSFAKPIWKL